MVFESKRHLTEFQPRNRLSGKKKKKKSRGKVGVVLILAYGKVVKILEEQACLPFKEEFIFQNDHIKVNFVSHYISRISDSKGGGIFLS